MMTVRNLRYKVKIVSIELFYFVPIDVFVMFDPQNYTVVEGSSIPITVVLDKPAAKEVIVTIDTTAGGNAEGKCN